MRMLLLINWPESGEWYFLSRLKKETGHVAVLQPFRWKVFQNKKLNRINIYLSEFYLPIIAFCMRKKFHAVVSWQMRLGICYGILNALFPRAATPHIIQDFHIDPARRDWKYTLRLMLLAMAIRGIDFFLCTSTHEKDAYSKRFGIPSERIAFLPYSPPPGYVSLRSVPRGDYLFAYGNSDRDFDTLIRAVGHLDIRVIILSRKFRPAAPLPRNVEHMYWSVPESQLIHYIAGARAVILPITHRFVAAGQVAMMETMALGRPLIVSANVATVEYAIDGQTALFFEPGDADMLSRHIRYLVENPETAEEIGRRARQTMVGQPDLEVDVFIKLLQQTIA